MYLKSKYCDEALSKEGPALGSRWDLVFNGAINTYGNGIGEFIITPYGSYILFTTRLMFGCTNNMQE